MPAFRVAVSALAVLMLAATAIVLSVVQTPAGAGQPELQSTPVQTIKVLIGPSSEGGTDCQFLSPAADAVGVYPGDTLVWNLENGCGTTATFRLLEPKLVFPPAFSAHVLIAGLEKWPKEVSVPSKERRQVVVRAAAARPSDPDTVAYQYDIEVSIAKRPRLPGPVVMCKLPPCPPPWTKIPK